MRACASALFALYLLLCCYCVTWWNRWCNCPRTACPVLVGLLVSFPFLFTCFWSLSLFCRLCENYHILTISRRSYRSISSVFTRLSASLPTKIVNVYAASNKIKRKMKKIFALQPASFLEN